MEYEKNDESFTMMQIIPILFSVGELPAFLGIVLIAGFVIKVFFENSRKEREQALAKSIAKIDEHIDTLRTNRLKYLIKNEYGILILEKWEKQKEYFYTKVLELGNNRVLTKREVFALIDSRIDEFDKKCPIESKCVDLLGPLEFEIFCAKLIQKNGWYATTTKGSGDQGVDVLAIKNKKKAIFQCKKYSKPVGNKAVQEAIAGKEFAGADFAFVVTNSTFTSAAIELSVKTKVFLIHYTELHNLKKFTGI